MKIMVLNICEIIYLILQLAKIATNLCLNVESFNHIFFFGFSKN